LTNFVTPIFLPWWRLWALPVCIFINQLVAQKLDEVGKVHFIV